MHNSTKQCPNCRAPVELPLHHCSDLKRHHNEVEYLPSRSVCSHKQRVCIAFKRYPPEPHSLCLRKESATSADNVASSPLQSASGRDGTARLRLKPSQWWRRQREGRFLQVFGGGFCAALVGVGRVGQTIGGCVCV